MNANTQESRSAKGMENPPSGRLGFFHASLHARWLDPPEIPQPEGWGSFTLAYIATGSGSRAIFQLQLHAQPVGRNETSPTFRLGDFGKRAGCRAVGKSERSPTSRLGNLRNRGGRSWRLDRRIASLFQAGFHKSFAVGGIPKTRPLGLL
jgi:hypothetical protein